MESKDDVAFEKILKLVGEDGKYQRLLFWLFLVPINILIPWMPLVAIFQASVPDHWCFVPGRPEEVPPDVWKNMTIPWVKKGEEIVLSKCLKFVRVNSDSGFVANTSSPDVEKCDYGWQYDDTWYDRTLTTDRNWVCDKDTYPSNWLSVAMMGTVFGTLIFDCLSDGLGRQPIMTITTQMFAVFGLIRLFVTTEWAAMITNVLSAMPFPAILQISIIIVLEQVSCNKRARINAVSFLAWAAGMSILPLIAWLSRNWITLGIVTAVPFMPFILMWWLLPESPRWLLSKGRADDAIKVLEKISIINGNPVSDELKSLVDEYISSKEGAVKGSYFTFLDLFKYPTLRKRTIVVTICHVSNGLVYYALLYNITNMSGNEFINFFYLSVTEFPADIVGWFAVQYIGRRWSGVAFLLLATLSVMLPLFVPSSMTGLITVCLVASKMWITASFLAIYIQCSEIFPTSHRSSGFGFVSILTTMLGASTPYIAYSIIFSSKLPYVLITLIGITGTVAAAFIPETLDCELPQTLSDANEFLKEQPFWSYLGKKPMRKSKQNDCKETTFDYKDY